MVIWALGLRSMGGHHSAWLDATPYHNHMVSPGAFTIWHTNTRAALHGQTMAWSMYRSGQAWTCWQYKNMRKQDVWR